MNTQTHPLRAPGSACCQAGGSICSTLPRSTSRSRTSRTGSRAWRAGTGRPAARIFSRSRSTRFWSRRWRTGARRGLDRSRRLAVLLHDAPEYVIGDMISPFKAVIGDAYKTVERRLLAAIHRRFGLPAKSPPELEKLIKTADRQAAFLEATRLAGFDIAEARRFFGRPPLVSHLARTRLPQAVAGGDGPGALSRAIRQAFCQKRRKPDRRIGGHLSLSLVTPSHRSRASASIRRAAIFDGIDLHRHPGAAVALALPVIAIRRRWSRRSRNAAPFVASTSGCARSSSRAQRAAAARGGANAATAEPLTPHQPASTPNRSSARTGNRSRSGPASGRNRPSPRRRCRHRLHRRCRPSAPRRPPPPPRSIGFEERFGTRWVVWVGGIALALGGIFLVRYTIQQGLIGPGVRIALGALLAARFGRRRRMVAPKRKACRHSGPARRGHSEHPDRRRYRRWLMRRSTRLMRSTNFCRPARHSFCLASLRF